VEKDICPTCPHDREVDNPLLLKLLRYRAMIDAGCPVERHELINKEWILLGVIRAESEKLAMKDAKNAKK